MKKLNICLRCDHLSEEVYMETIGLVKNHVKRG